MSAKQEKNEKVLADLRTALITQGILNIDDLTAVVGHTRGPELERVCLQVGTNAYLWAEVALPEGKYYPVERLQGMVEVCHFLVGEEDLPVRTALPILISPAYSIYTNLPSSMLLFQLLMGFTTGLRFQEGWSHFWQHLPGFFNTLGRYLGRCHSLVLPVQPIQNLQTTSSAIELARSFLQLPPFEELTFSQADMTLREIVLRHPLLIEAIRSACAVSLQASDPVQLHGFFSAGKIIISSDVEHPLSGLVLGGINTWYGPSAYDPGFLLGELLLLLAISRFLNRGLERDLLLMGRAFIQGYCSVRSVPSKQKFLKDVYAYSALRLVDELLRNARYIGLMADYVEKVIDSAEELLPQWQAALFAGEEKIQQYEKEVVK
jgi:hypothetical protein